MNSNQGKASSSTAVEPSLQHSHIKIYRNTFKGCLNSVTHRAAQANPPENLADSGGQNSVWDTLPVIVWTDWAVKACPSMNTPLILQVCCWSYFGRTHLLFLLLVELEMPPTVLSLLQNYGKLDSELRKEVIYFSTWSMIHLSCNTLSAAISTEQLLTCSV